MRKIKYKNIITATFISRPNRFIANCIVDGVNVVCHVKNTGRCKELLYDGVKVILEKSDNPKRKTQYDLIAVYKGDRLINIDSQIPNDVVEEFLPELFKDIKYYKREQTYKKSRFDFYIETNDEKFFLEVKGVTLEQDNIVLFPDAPTERGVKHINELIKSLDEGYSAYLLFVVQMSDVKYFTPNKSTHPEFAVALKNAYEKGVKIIAYDCFVSENEIKIKNQVSINTK